MIKNLKSKLIICLFLLVTIFSVTSSCFAVLTAPFSIDNLYASTAFVTANETLGRGLNSSNSKVLVHKEYGLSMYNIWVVPNSVAYVQINSAGTYFYMYDSNGNSISNNYSTILGSYSSGSFTFYTDASSYNMYGSGPRGKISQVTDISTVKVLNSDGSVYFEPAPQMSVDVTHEFQSDTSAKVNFTVDNAPDGAILKYSLTGVEVSTDLTAPLQLRNPITYTPRSE